jgi:dTDP-glucose pyrophosphorylase
VEKPSKPKTSLRGTGIYIFDPIAFDFIRRTPPSPPRQEIEITDTLRLIAREHRFYAAYLEGINVNINTLSDYLAAVRCLRKHKLPAEK